uniref:GCR036 n=1 Tax=Schmidtea mediterranea TaxID=79327 RepID=A0A193KUG2_SCHMD|nr:GCR036 [Schmidtea mediterranea]
MFTFQFIQISKMTLMTQDGSQVAATLIMLSVICVIGSLGNGLVIIVYTRKHDQLTTTLFINILAITDCFTCITIIPMTIYIEYWEWGISSAFLCKLYYFFNNCTIPFSAFLISLIAIDRYICICHPFNKFMTLFKSKVSVGLVLTVSVLLGIASTFQVKMIKGIHPNDLTNSYECADISKLTNTTTTEKLFFSIVQKIQLLSYTTCIILVICLYVAIYCKVLQTRRKKSILKGIKNVKKPSYLWESRSNLTNVPDLDENPIKLPDGDTMLSSAKSTPNSKSFLTVPKPEHRRVSLRSICDTQIFQNFRTAAMLSVVALMYIISFLPAFLMINYPQILYIPLFYMYYINNAANPIIYCFMNARFREDIKAIVEALKK